MMPIYLMHHSVFMPSWSLSKLLIHLLERLSSAPTTSTHHRTASLTVAHLCAMPASTKHDTDAVSANYKSSSENVYLFYPVGGEGRWASKPLLILLCRPTEPHRLCENTPRSYSSRLDAVPPESLYNPLWHICTPRRCRRRCGSQVWHADQLWVRSRYAV